MRVFLWERQADAESLADQAMDRVARRVNEGVEVVDVPAYAHRVAELMLLEARRAGQRREAALDAHARLSPPDRSSAAVERRHACLEACLARLEPEQRDLILRYYSADGRARIEQRDALAKAQGIPLGALRNRALRLREKLEDVHHCLLEPAGSFGLDGHNRVRGAARGAGRAARTGGRGERSSHWTMAITTSGGRDSSGICSARWTTKSARRCGKR